MHGRLLLITIFLMYVIHDVQIINLHYWNCLFLKGVWRMPGPLPWYVIWKKKYEGNSVRHCLLPDGLVASSPFVFTQRILILFQFGVSSMIRVGYNLAASARCCQSVHFILFTLLMVEYGILSWLQRNATIDRFRGKNFYCFCLFDRKRKVPSTLCSLPLLCLCTLLRRTERLQQPQMMKRRIKGVMND